MRNKDNRHMVAILLSLVGTSLCILGALIQIAVNLLGGNRELAASITLGLAAAAVLLVFGTVGIEIVEIVKNIREEHHAERND